MSSLLHLNREYAHAMYIDNTHFDPPSSLTHPLHKLNITNNHNNKQYKSDPEKDGNTSNTSESPKISPQS